MRSVAEKRGDIVFTPDWAAADIVRYFQPSGKILEPCRGAGAFMRHLPDSTLWCELTEGRDFFLWEEPIDWIVTNPPYSKTREFLKHALKVARNIVFLVPARNIFSGYGCVRECNGWGGMRAIRWYGTGGRLGFPMGNAVAAIHWQRGHTTGIVIETFYDNETLDLLGVA